MKKSILFLVLMFFLTSCDKVYWHEFVVVNETPHFINIEGFDKDNTLTGTPEDSAKVPTETIEVLPYSDYSIEKIQGSDREIDNIFVSDKIFSVLIIFNENKAIVQFCPNNPIRFCEIERNIFGFDSEYEKEKKERFKGNVEYRYTYTITEEDYNRAVPIED